MEKFPLPSPKNSGFPGGCYGLSDYKRKKKRQTAEQKGKEQKDMKEDRGGKRGSKEQEEEKGYFSAKTSCVLLVRPALLLSGRCLNNPPPHVPAKNTWETSVMRNTCWGDGKEKVTPLASQPHFPPLRYTPTTEAGNE